MRKFMLALMFFGASACAIFGAGSRDQVGQYASQIEHCQELGRECHAESGAPDGKDPECAAVYDTCMQDAGLR